LATKETSQNDNAPPAAGAFPGGLLPRLGLFTAVMIVMGNLIGSGVFKKAAPMAEELQSPGLLLACWLIAGGMSLLGALSNAEVAGMIADPGGQYSYFKKMYGRAFAFLYGWTGFIVIQCASIGSIAYVFGQSANSLFAFPRLDASWEAVSVFGVFYPFENLGVKLFTILTLFLITSANYLGVIFGGWIAGVSSTMKILGIAVVAVLGLAWSGGSFENLTPVLANPDAHYRSSLGLFGAMFAGMLGAFWAYDGWVNIAFMGGEIRNPHRNIPLALGIGVAGCVALYLLVNVSYLLVMSVDEMRRVAATDNAIVGVEVMRKAFGNTAAGFVAVLILVSTFGATNCSLMQPSRMFYSMAKDGLFFRAAAACHPKHHTPSTALWIQAAWTSALVMSGTFDQLTDMVVFASFLFYGAGAFGVFVLRRTMKDAPRPYRVTGYPVLTGLFVVFCLVLVVVTVIERPRDAGLGLVLIMTGLPFYLYWRKRPPVPETDNAETREP
jgi:APA family basic amino acid/polyamine antiporter